MACQQREEYIAPVCEVMTFEAADAITRDISRPLQGPKHLIGGDVYEESLDDN